MDTRTVRGIVNLIRAQRSRGERRLADQDSDSAYDTKRFEDDPFVNELCLTLLVAIWHQVERELIHRAARVTVGRAPSDPSDYVGKIREARKRVRNEGVPTIAKTLGIEWPDWLDALRVLVNCYKHDPEMRPDEKLLRHLGLPARPKEPLVVAYAPLPESQLVLDGWTAFLGLAQEADYCTVVEQLITRIEQFMAHVDNVSPLSSVKRGPVSLSEFEG